jgi:hypothetical protein
MTGFDSQHGRDFSHYHHAQTGSVAHLAASPMGTGSEADKHEADHYHLVPRLRMHGAFLPLLLYSFMCSA